MKNPLLCTVAISWLLIAVSSLPVNSAFAATYSLTVDGGIRQGGIPHFWSECVGTGTMEYCLKPAWTTAARIRVRPGSKWFEGMEFSSTGTVLIISGWDQLRTGISRSSIRFMIQVIACGLKPVVELSSCR